MNWFSKYLLKSNSPHEESTDEQQLNYYFGLFLSAGLIISILLLVYKEVFRTDLSNPVAETATVLMFGAALFFLIRGKREMAVNMLFFIPLLGYLYYLSGFSNSDSLSTTIYNQLLWYISGLVVLVFMDSFSTRYILLYILGLVSLGYHATAAGTLSHYLSSDQNLASNPFLILTLVFTVLVSIRIQSDKKLNRLRDQKQEAEQQIKDFNQQIDQPVAQIKAIQDPDGNIVRLEISRVNHVFESSFRISLQEAKMQEVNYLFNFIFRNDTNWNDLFIIDPKTQAEIFSPSLGKWYILKIIWLNPRNCFCIFNDITQEKNELKVLNDTKARYLALLQAIPDIFFVIERDGTFQDVVFKGQENLYLETSEVIGNTIFDAGFSKMMSDKIYQCIQRSIDHDSIETIEYSLDIKGTTLLYEMRLAKLNENSVVSIARDITRRKKAEFELEAAKIRAEEANSLKSKFLANLSHDIRTPMNIILGYTKMLAESDMSDYQREDLIHEVQQQGFTLLHIIENTIQLSKIETNTLEVNQVYTNIHHLLHELFQDFYPLLPDHRDLQLKMQNELQSDNVGFETDPTLLKESLYRLIDNAIKFTSEGMVTFGYTTAPGNSVEFFVADTGPGIHPSEQENIFLRFYVIEADRLAQKSGPGLGLPIAQHFVALLGGRLAIDSAPGKGSRFWFRLPLKNSKGFMRVV